MIVFYFLLFELAFGLVELLQEFHKLVLHSGTSPDLGDVRRQQHVPSNLARFTQLNLQLGHIWVISNCNRWFHDHRSIFGLVEL